MLGGHGKKIERCTDVPNNHAVEIIYSQKDCNHGEIVAAMIDGEATVKTFSRKNGHIWLMPAAKEEIAELAWLYFAHSF